MYAEELFASLREWHEDAVAQAFLHHNVPALNLLSASNLRPDGFVQTSPQHQPHQQQHDDDDDDTSASRGAAHGADLSLKRSKHESAQGNALTAEVTGSCDRAPAGAVVSSVTRLVVRAACCGVSTALDEDEREGLARLEMASALLMDSETTSDSAPASDSVQAKRGRSSAALSRTERQRRVVDALLRRAHDGTCLRRSGLAATRFLFGVQSLSLRDSLLVRAHCAVTEVEFAAEPAASPPQASTSAAPVAKRTHAVLPRATPPTEVLRLTASTNDWFDAGTLMTNLSTTVDQRLRYHGSNTNPQIMALLLRIKRPRDVTAAALATHVPESDEEAQSVTSKAVLLMQLHGFGVHARRDSREWTHTPAFCVDSSEGSDGTVVFAPIVNAQDTWDWVRWSPSLDTTSTTTTETESAVLSGPEIAQVVWAYLQASEDVTESETNEVEGGTAEDSETFSPFVMPTTAHRVRRVNKHICCHYCGASPGVTLKLRRRPIWALVEASAEAVDVKQEEEEVESNCAGHRHDQDDDGQEHEVLVDAECLDRDSTETEAEEEAPTPRVSAPREPDADGEGDNTTVGNADDDIDALCARGVSPHASAEVGSQSNATATHSETADVMSIVSEATTTGEAPRSPPQMRRQCVGYTLVDAEVTLSFLAHDRVQTHKPDCPWHDGALSALIDTHTDKSTSLLDKPMDFFFERPPMRSASSSQPAETASDDDVVEDNGNEKEKTEVAPAHVEDDGTPDALAAAPAVTSTKSSVPREAASSPPPPHVVVCLRFEREDVVRLLMCWTRSEEQERSHLRPYLTHPLPALVRTCERDGSLFTLSAPDDRAELEAFLAELDEVGSEPHAQKDSDEERSQAGTVTSALWRRAEAGGSIGDVLALVERAQTLFLDGEPASAHASTASREANNVAALEAAEQYLRARAAETSRAASTSTALQTLFAGLEAQLDHALPDSALAGDDEDDDEDDTDEAAAESSALLSQARHDVASRLITALVTAEYGPQFLPRLAEEKADGAGAVDSTSATGTVAGDVPAATEDSQAQPSSALTTRLAVIPTTLAMGLRTPALLSAEEQARVEAWTRTHLESADALMAATAPRPLPPSVTPTSKVQHTPPPSPSTQKASAPTRSVPVAGAGSVPTGLNPQAKPFVPAQSPAAAASANTNRGQHNDRQPGPPPPRQQAPPSQATWRPNPSSPAPSSVPPYSPPPHREEAVLGAASSSRQQQQQQQQQSPQSHWQQRQQPPPNISNSNSNSNNNSSAILGHRQPHPSAPTGTAAAAGVFGQSHTPTPSVFQTQPRPTQSESILGTGLPAAPAPPFGATSSSFGGAAAPRSSPPPPPSARPGFSFAGTPASHVATTTSLTPRPNASSAPVFGTPMGSNTTAAAAGGAFIMNTPSSAALSLGTTSPAAAAPVLPSHALVGTPSPSFRSVLGNSNNSSAGGAQDSSFGNDSPSPSASFVSRASPPPPQSHQQQQQPRGSLLTAPPPFSQPEGAQGHPMTRLGAQQMAGSNINNNNAGGAGFGGFGNFAQANAGRGFTFQVAGTTPAPGPGDGVFGNNRAGGPGGEAANGQSNQPVFGLASAAPLPGSAISGVGMGFGRPSVFGSPGGGGGGRTN